MCYNHDQYRRRTKRHMPYASWALPRPLAFGFLTTLADQAPAG